MFLAIINDSYIEVKTELSKQKNELEIADFMSQVKNFTMLNVLKFSNTIAHLKELG